MINYKSVLVTFKDNDTHICTNHSLDKTYSVSSKNGKVRILHKGAVKLQFEVKDIKSFSIYDSETKETSRISEIEGNFKEIANTFVKWWHYPAGHAAWNETDFHILA